MDAFTITIAGLFILVDGSTVGQPGTAHAVLVRGGGGVHVHKPLFLIPKSAVVMPLPSNCKAKKDVVSCKIVGSVVTVETGADQPPPLKYGSPSPKDRLIPLKDASGGADFETTHLENHPHSPVSARIFMTTGTVSAGDYLADDAGTPIEYTIGQQDRKLTSYISWEIPYSSDTMALVFDGPKGKQRLVVTGKETALLLHFYWKEGPPVADAPTDSCRHPMTVHHQAAFYAFVKNPKSTPLPHFCADGVTVTKPWWNIKGLTPTHCPPNQYP